MKNNQPITQHEVEYEESDVFVTRTDTKGVITSANEAFCRISGFTKQELIGQSHNIVRHPDMPGWAFKSLWDTVKSGRPWRGLVKNRCKNGDYYWVRATISPVIENNSVVGYLSMRKKPTRKEVADADAIYRANPKAAPKKPFSISGWFCDLGIKAKINLLVQPLLFLFLSAGTYAVYKDVSASIVDDAIINGKAVAMQVIDTANMMMVTGSISDASSRQLMIKKIIDGQGLSSLKLVRTDQVVKQFGQGLPEERLDDPLVKSTIESALKDEKATPFAKIQMVDGKPMLRVITPYMASHDFHGTDCIGCHQVNDHSVNGASDLTISLSANFNRLHRLLLTIIAWQISAQVMAYLVLGWVLNRFVLKPIKEVRNHLNEVVNGDFSRMVNIDNTDEAGLMLCSVQSNKVLVGAVIDHVRTTAKLVNQNADRLSQSVSTAGDVSHAQAEASHSMASSIEEMSASINSVAENATEVRRISSDSAQRAESGGATVKEVVLDMVAIGKEVSDAADAVRALGVRSDEINEIVKVIKAIADQTNLLALNAAIEAARAGEQGRGFAVVADEVRKLAEKTASSTTTVGFVVDGIRAGTLDAIRMIESAVGRAQRGEALACTAGVAISDIANSAGVVLIGVSDITSSIQEQSASSRDIATKIELIAQKAEDNSRLIMGVDESAKILAHLSAELKKQTDSYII